jgi:CBS domain-containing protein
MAERGSVGEIMRKDPVSLDVADRLDLVEEVMSLGRIRHLPILERGRLVGIVSQRDLLARSLDRALRLGPRARRAFLASLRVAEAMTRQPICVGEATSQRDAASLMIRHRIGCLPVVDGDGALIGIVSETDLLRAAYVGGELAG